MEVANFKGMKTIDPEVVHDPNFHDPNFHRKHGCSSRVC